MNLKIGGPGWDRTNDQPIMSRLNRSPAIDPSHRLHLASELA